MDPPSIPPGFSAVVAPTSRPSISRDIHDMPWNAQWQPSSTEELLVTNRHAAFPKNQSCALETPLRLRSSARGRSSTLLERPRVAPSDSQARRVSTQSALITQPVRNGRDVHAGADSSAFALSRLCHSIFPPSLFHDYVNGQWLCSGCGISKCQTILLKMVLTMTEFGQYLIIWVSNGRVPTSPGH